MRNVGLLLMLLLAGCGEPVGTCNDSGVKKTLLDETIGAYKAKRIEFLRTSGMRDVARRDLYLRKLQAFDASITDVSEIRYDRASQTRACSAQVSYTNMFQGDSDDGLFSAFFGLGPVVNGRDLCRNIEYLVRPLIDKPGQLQVRWACR